MLEPEPSLHAVGLPPICWLLTKLTIVIHEMGVSIIGVLPPNSDDLLPLHVSSHPPIRKFDQPAAYCCPFILTPCIRCDCWKASRNASRQTGAGEKTGACERVSRPAAPTTPNSPSSSPPHLPTPPAPVPSQRGREINATCNVVLTVH